jgi:hypothetical protein
MKPKDEALKRIEGNPAPFMIRIQIKEPIDPKKYEHTDEKGKKHLIIPPSGAKRAKKSGIGDLVESFLS